MMQRMAKIAPDRRRVGRVLRLLERAYGPRRWRRWGSGVSELVGTILSQNTSNANSSAGYRQLWRRFRSWNRVADAPTAEVERCIRISGLSRIKAPRIQRILRQIRADRGRIDLQFLAGRPPERALEYLLAFDGVGPKTANCVLLFAFGMPVFPVDTHIHRIAIRLGWTRATATAEQAHDLLAPAIAPADRYAMHILLIEHGRVTCKARSPRCEWCDLLALCPFGRGKAAAGAMPATVSACGPAGAGSRRPAGPSSPARGRR
jgi:endonuclease-3